jgi:hypothetical protein
MPLKPSNTRPQGAQDFTGRLPPAVSNADPGMVVQPGADPGYRMPNALEGNLNQSPGQIVGGWLPAGGAASPSPRQPGNAALAPWIASLPMALKMWHQLSTDQQTMYLLAYQAHTNALSAAQPPAATQGE